MVLLSIHARKSLSGGDGFYFKSLAACSEGDSLLVELVEVLVVDAGVLEFLYFGRLDSLDFVSLVVDFLSYFSALLQEVQSVLLFMVLII